MLKMSGRERTLLIAFAVLLAGVLYYLLFFNPMQTKMAQVESDISDTEDSITAAQIMIAKKEAMQKELDEIFAAANGNPTRIPDYDNVQSVIRELNQILAESGQYSLNFGDLEDSSDSIVRRPVDLSFSCDGYDTVRSILEQLGSSEFRSLITDVSITNRTTADANYTASNTTQSYAYSVTAHINFYEYSQTPVTASAETDEAAAGGASSPASSSADTSLTGG